MKTRTSPLHRAAAALLAVLLLASLAGCQRSEVIGIPDSTPAPSAPAATPEATAAPETAAPETDAAGEGLALLGEWSEDHVYTNEVFGLRYTLPENWVYASREEILARSQLTLESGLMTEKEAAALESAQTLFIMMAEDPLTGSNVMVITENLAGLPGADRMDEEQYAALTIESLTQSGREFQAWADDPFWAELAGMDFLAIPIELSYGEATLRQMTYTRRIGDRMLSIGFTSADGTRPEEGPGGLAAFSGL